METDDLSAYTKSIFSPDVPNNCFPNLVLRSCISEASESLNGARYLAQEIVDLYTYEVRCVPFEPSRGSLDRWAGQENRMEQLRRASARHLPFVSLPYSIFLHKDEDKRFYVCSVEGCAGLSLGDIARSGWTLIQESLFNDVLETVEAYGKLSPLLPIHGNFSADAIKQLLTLREVMVESAHRPRWVVCDWLLTDVEEQQYDMESCIGDLEWVLTSTFSQFRIQKDKSDTFLSPSDLESRVALMAQRIRDALMQYHFHETVNDAGVPFAELQEEMIRNFHLSSSTLPVSADPVKPSTRNMSVKEKIFFHQSSQREEKQQLNRYRRRHAELPPRLHQPEASPDYALDDEMWKPHKLSSPIHVRPTQLFTLAGDPKASHESSPRSQAAHETIVSRQEVVDDIVQLALLYEDRVSHERAAEVEGIQSQREALRGILAQSAALSTARSRAHNTLHSRKKAERGRDLVFSFDNKPMLEHEMDYLSRLTINAMGNRRRTLSVPASRLQTPRKPSVVTEKSSNSFGSPKLLTTSIAVAGSPKLSKEIQNLKTSGRAPLIVTSFKRKSEPYTTPSSASVTLTEASPNEQYRASSSPTFPSYGSVSSPIVHPQNNQVSPISLALQDVGASAGFPDVPKIITLGDMVPPRKKSISPTKLKHSPFIGLTLHVEEPTVALGNDSPSSPPAEALLPLKDEAEIVEKKEAGPSLTRKKGKAKNRVSADVSTDGAKTKKVRKTKRTSKKKKKNDRPNSARQAFRGTPSDDGKI